MRGPADGEDKAADRRQQPGAGAAVIEDQIGEKARQAVAVVLALPTPRRRRRLGR
jgi:hypothetical protein